MKIYLTDQASNFDTLLAALMATPTMVFDKTKLIAKTTTINLNTNKSLDQIDLGFFFNYQVFPTEILTFRTQWQLEKRKMKVGDTILQQVFIPPIKTFSQKIIFGVRINEIIDEVDRKGYSYVTLQGHVEKGESSFIIERSGNALTFKISTFSAPGNILTKLVGPIFTVPYQTYCTRRALENVRLQIEQMTAK